MKQTTEFGLIYGLTNPYFSGLVKIGMTHCLDITKRISVLNTAVPLPFECAFAYRVPNDSIGQIEHVLHKTYHAHRVGTSEFFKVDPAQVDELLRTLGKFEPMKTTVQSSIDIVEAKHKNPNMDFFAMGLHEGQVLVYKNDPTVTCSVKTNNRVLYQGEDYSLSRLTHQLLGSKYAVQPSPYWLTEDGTLLSTLYIAYTKHLAADQAPAHAAVASAAASVSADFTNH